MNSKKLSTATRSLHFSPLPFQAHRLCDTSLCAIDREHSSLDTQDGPGTVHEASAH